MTREEVIAAIRECAAELKRTPGLQELKRIKKIGRGHIKTTFGTLNEAIRGAGLKPKGTGYQIKTEDLLLDWARVARQQGRLPTAASYTREGHYSPGPFMCRFARWARAGRAFVSFVRKKKIEGDWKDVLAMIAESDSAALEVNPRLDPEKHRPDRPVYGPPLVCPGTIHEPVNELGVIYLFGALSQKLGFVMLRMQPGFPDCEAMRQVGPAHWQRVRIEFEFASRNFNYHGHYAKECDMIVCWIHDWQACPKELEVLELRKVVRGM